MYIYTCMRVMYINIKETQISARDRVRCGESECVTSEEATSLYIVYPSDGCVSVSLVDAATSNSSVLYTFA